jgi:hypothetical protein
MKNLVFTSAGNNTVFHKWLDGRKTFDIYLAYYGDSEEKYLEYQSKATCFKRKGSKFQNFQYFYNNFDILQYDYFFIIDDDIIMDGHHIEKMFQYAKDYNLLICQPSFDTHSKISHTITENDKDIILSYTNFVEVNVPLFKKEALDKLMNKFDEKLIGWGIDFISIFANDKNKTDKYAVIHDITCTNPKDNAKPIYELSLVKDYMKREEIWLEYSKRHGYFSYEPIVYSSIPKPPRTVWENYCLEIISKPLKSIESLPCPPIGYLECFARIFSSISPWESNPVLNRVLSSFDEMMQKFDSLELFSHKQAIIECGYICYGFLLSSNWKKLSDSAQSRFIRILRKVRLLHMPWHSRTNWLLFHTIIEVFFKFVGTEYNEEFINSSIITVNKWYCGDGFYNDGDRQFKMDYYNSYCIQPLFIEILKVMKDELLPVAIERCILYSEFLERIICEDGTYPPLGRSIVYRFGAFHLLSYCILNGHISKNHSYGQLQKALTTVIRKGVKGIYEDGFLSLGFTGKQESIADSYSNVGSCYLACMIFLPLGLPPNHPFWSSENPFTQELAWNNKPFVKYIMDDKILEKNVAFILHGDDYSQSLYNFLNKNYDVIIANESDVEYPNKILIIHTSDFNLKKKFSCRVVEIYIGKSEDMECLTILSHLDTHFIQSALNSFCLKCLQPKRVLLVSPGGSACTAFLGFLQDKLTINTPNSFIDGGDGLKHCLDNSYHVEAYNPTQVIYLYGDLETTVRSLFRRGLNDISYFYDEKQKFMNPLMRLCKRDVKYYCIQDYIKDVLKTKEEPMGIIKHWKSWKASNRNIYFIHYADIYKQPRLDTFLGLSPGTCSKFTVKQRVSVRIPDEANDYLDILRKIDLERGNILSYSNNDRFIADYFKGSTGGFFVEVGDKLDTYLLEKRYAWSGICVEHVSNINRKCICVNKYAHNISGIDININGTDVQTTTLTHILDFYKAPTYIHYLSINCNTENVLKGIDFKKYSFGIISSEFKIDGYRLFKEPNLYIKC